jgi:hypothetical protein
MPVTAPSVSLSSAAVPGNSAALSMNYYGGKPWSALVVTASSSGTADFTLQYTLQDLTSSNYASSGVATAPSWNNWTAANGINGLSSAFTSSNGYPSLHFTSSTIDTAAGLLVWGAYPVAGLRISSTGMSSTTLTLYALQGVGW